MNHKQHTERASAHAKLVLLGEHVVLHGCPALTVQLDRELTVECRPLEEAPDRWVLPEALSPEQRSLGQAVLDLLKRRLSLTRHPVQLTLESSIPLGRNLGSSAAFCLALAEVLQRCGSKQPDPTTTAQLAREAESLIHGQSSGMDILASQTPGLAVITPTDGTLPTVEKVTTDLSLPLVIGFTPHQRSTREMIERVSKRLRDDGFKQATLTTYQRMHAEAIRALRENQLPALGAALNQAHALNQQLGISTPEIDRLCQLVLSLGALGAKITGGGGGGAFVVLCQDEASQREVEQPLHEQGVETMVFNP